MGMMDLLYRTYEYAYEAEDAQLMENYLMSQTTATAPILLWLNERGSLRMPDISPIRRNRRSASPVRRNQQGVPGRIRFPIRCSINCFIWRGMGRNMGLTMRKPTAHIWKIWKHGAGQSGGTVM